MVYYNQKKYPTAFGFFSRIKEAGQTSRFPMSHFFLGMILAKQNKLPEAATEFRSYLELTPEELIPPELKTELTKQLKSWEAKGLLNDSGLAPSVFTFEVTSLD